MTYVKADRSKQRDPLGYDEFALRAAIAMAGVRAVGDYIATLTGHSTSTALHKLRDGDWSRSDIMHMIDAFHLTQEQVIAIFFNGREWEENVERRKRYYSWLDEEDNRWGKNKPDTVAMKLDHALNMLDADGVLDCGKWSEYRTRYCGECGAKMDKG